MTISVLILAYKESENLKILIPEIQEEISKITKDYEIIVVDGQISQDNTLDVCRKYNSLYYNQEEPGYAGAFRTGIKHVTKQNTLVLDADGSHNPKYIPVIAEKFSQGYDIVIGSRYIKGGVSNDSRTSYVMSKILNATMRFCLGIKAKDISTSFRMYDTSQIKKITLKCKNYDVLQEIILKMKINKIKNHEEIKIGEIPITFEKRVYGKSKRKLFKFILGYIKTLFVLTVENFKVFFD